ncbi:uncharacterized protein HMPREF1541_07183 [Cyphellophora europaea CBS 101466]|uniref:Uncharacterized protein n=1 Tax=Cyphellophora europaea (strain CBS 101466) TaxID=1220924 RepID=W2RM21_CYPE1|nr:uncharacterized protein HMPREF1541_07183 [Cyphellophora europaea CBS 101466]ETN37561.1 hypothetical protein HMPREF1541_07183 [Cyphellophora europaea CBS 101466]
MERPILSSPRLPRPQTLLTSDQISLSTIHTNITTTEDSDDSHNDQDAPPLPPLPSPSSHHHTFLQPNTPQHPAHNADLDPTSLPPLPQDPTSSYSEIIRFRPPRSDSIYQLHDYSSSPVGPAEDEISRDGRGGAAGGVPPVPQLNWPLPASAPENMRGAVPSAATISGPQGGLAREAPSMTALPPVVMTEIYRPKVRVEAAAKVKGSGVRVDAEKSAAMRSGQVTAHTDGTTDAPWSTSPSLGRRVRAFFSKLRRFGHRRSDRRATDIGDTSTDDGNQKAASAPAPASVSASASANKKLHKRPPRHSDSLLPTSSHAPPTTSGSGSGKITNRDGSTTEYTTEVTTDLDAAAASDDEMDIFEALRSPPPSREATLPTIPSLPRIPRYVAREAGSGRVRPSSMAVAVAVAGTDAGAGCGVGAGGAASRPADRKQEARAEASGHATSIATNAGNNASAVPVPAPAPAPAPVTPPRRTFISAEEAWALQQKDAVLRAETRRLEEENQALKAQKLRLEGEMRVLEVEKAGGV